MDPRFAHLVNRLHPAFMKLVLCQGVSDGPTRNYAEEGLIPTNGVYLFTEAGTHLFVGRSNRLFDRFSTQLPLVFKLAQEGAKVRRATYKFVPNGRERPSFAEASEGAMVQAEARVRAMEFRWVEEDDPTCRCLLQIYAAVALATKYNGFDIH